MNLLLTTIMSLLGISSASFWYRTQLKIYRIRPIKHIKQKTQYFINNMIISWHTLAENERDLIEFIVSATSPN
jgi:hypothetical protein